MSNHLKSQSSPYLLQHAENPVDWYPWGEEAFEKAKRENKPIFLSIGYSTCHWCHVMAEESFENAEIAEILNQHFISIKVDREERPDIDSVYMSVCQALTGSGGWPMSIFMTAEQKPFFAGTYFPPTSQYGGIGFQNLLLGIAKKWSEEPFMLTNTADEILSQIKEESKSQAEMNANLPELAVRLFSRIYDKEYGGFGEAPKFPTPHNLFFLTFYAQLYKEKGGEALQMVSKTLEHMRRGGIFDQIGYGFSRYSTDRYYLCPHFEKMLYDNALLIMAYCWGYTATSEKLFLRTAEETAAYVFREMTGANGEFYSAQDADSEGAEGRFYTWEYEEVLKVLGKERGEAFCRHYGMTKEGNFEGRNIPNLLNGNAVTDSFEKERKMLYEYRSRRAKLHLDDKVLTSWNALMISALSVLYRVTGKNCYRTAAKKAGQFIEKRLAQADQLYVSYRENICSTKGFLDDYAYYAWALLSLYDATLEERYLTRAKQICAEARRQFAATDGGYYLCGTENQQLITRPKETYDGALPSGNSVMAYVLVRLSSWTNASEDRKAAEMQLAFLSGEAGMVPHAHSMFLIALLVFQNPPPRITVVRSKEEAVDSIMANLPLYADISILEHESDDYKLLNGRTTYYVCKDHVCLPPTNQYREKDSIGKIKNF